MYDFVVVGAGLIGSAAAKYICQLSPESQVCLIGPSDPSLKERCLGSGRQVYGAHDDEGRITRTFSSDPIWGKLANRSIRRYRRMEQESGVPFFTDVGSMAIVKTDKTEALIQSCDENSAMATVISGQQLRRELPFLSVPDKCAVVWEKCNAGHVSPRSLVRAQCVLARKYGCHILRDVVTAVQECSEKNCSKLLLEYGTPIYTKTVLLATGSVTNFLNLLPAHLSLSATPFTQTVVLAELSEDQAKDLASMPSILLDNVWHNGSSVFDPLTYFYHAYILPPARYPNGRVYLKIGHGKEHDLPLRDLQSYREWYCGKGSPAAVASLSSVLQRLVPSLQPQSFLSDTCVTLRTESGHVYVDSVPGVSCGMVYVAIGGNGSAAKSSDEIGLMAAKMVVNGSWNHDLSSELFKAHWKHGQATSKL